MNVASLFAKFIIPEVYFEVLRYCAILFRPNLSLERILFIIEWKISRIIERRIFVPELFSINSLMHNLTSEEVLFLAGK